MYSIKLTFTTNEGDVSESTLSVADLQQVARETLIHLRNSGKITAQDELTSISKTPLSDGRFKLELEFTPSDGSRKIVVAILPLDPAQGPSS